jgi:hypothetical protein
MAETILFDRDHVDQLESISDGPRRLRASQLLWVDMRRGEDADEIARVLSLDDRTRGYLETAHDTPVPPEFGHYIHITSYAPRGDDDGTCSRSSAW